MHPRTRGPLAPAQLGGNVLLLGGREAGRLLCAQGGHSSGVVRACFMGAEHGSSQTDSSLPSGGAQVSEQAWPISSSASPFATAGTLERLVGRTPSANSPSE